VLILAGVAVCAVAVSGLVRDRPAERDFGATSTPVAIARAGDIRAGRPMGNVPTGNVPTGNVPAAGPAVRIQIPALDVDAHVDSVATVDGNLTVPEDPQAVGWWAGSAEPGSRGGTVVLDGHVDSASRGLGAFFRLTELRGGDAVTVTTARGDQVIYHVTGRLSYPKADGLPPDLFATDGPPRLILITCGGQFDHEALSYLDNVVVFATPTP
jgi:hypothetical protein